MTRRFLLLLKNVFLIYNKGIYSKLLFFVSIYGILQQNVHILCKDCCILNNALPFDNNYNIKLHIILFCLNKLKFEM